MKLTDYKFLKKVLQERLMSSTSESEDAHTAILLSKIEGNIVKLTIEGNCRLCKKPFTEFDAKVGVINNTCTSCFTSNA